MGIKRCYNVDREAWRCDSWGRKGLDTTEWLDWTELNWTCWQFWRPEIQCQGVHRFGFFWGFSMGMPSTVLPSCLQPVMSSRICISRVLFSSWKDTSQTGLGPCLNSLNLITSFKFLFPNIVTFWGLGTGTSISDFGERGRISVHNTWPEPDFLSSHSVRMLFSLHQVFAFFFLRDFFFLMGTIFKVFIEFVTILLLFYGWFFFFLALRHVGP